MNLLDMRADQVGMDVLFITADFPPLRNLGLCVERCHVELAGRVLTPYAAGLGCLLQTEKETGAICIDMGGETTSVAVFLEEKMVFADMIKLGSNYITRDISK